MLLKNEKITGIPGDGYGGRRFAEVKCKYAI